MSEKPLIARRDAMRENERCPACGNRPGELPSCGRCGEPKEPCCLGMAGGTMCSCPKEYELSDVRMQSVPEPARVTHWAIIPEPRDHQHGDLS